jgi:hypothetical protein
VLFGIIYPTYHPSCHSSTVEYPSGYMLVNYHPQLPSLSDVRRLWINSALKKVEQSTFLITIRSQQHYPSKRHLECVSLLLSFFQQSPCHSTSVSRLHGINLRCATCACQYPIIRLWKPGRRNVYHEFPQTNICFA